MGKKKNKKDYYTSGLEKYNAKKYLSAILFFQAALDNDPDNEDVLKMLAKTYGKTGNLGLQQQTLRKIQKNNPNICTSQKTTATSSNNSTLSCQSKDNRPSHIKRIWEWLSPDKTEIILRYILALFLLLFITFFIKCRIVVGHPDKDGLVDAWSNSNYLFVNGLG